MKTILKSFQLYIYLIQLIVELKFSELNRFFQLYIQKNMEEKDHRLLYMFASNVGLKLYFE